jgi:amidase
LQVIACPHDLRETVRRSRDNSHFSMERVMKRPLLVLFALLALGLPLSADRAERDDDRSSGFQIVEATIPGIQRALDSGQITVEELVQMYLDRIEAYDRSGPRLNSYIHVNARALEVARQLECALGDEDNDGHHRGNEGDDGDDRGRPGDNEGAALCGVPIVLKDNVDTFDMPTTAGSVALAGSIPPNDAFIARKLRKAGAVILGKASLTEFANFLTTGMPAGYSSLAGYGFNPYDPRPDPRPLPLGDGRPVLTPGGSSSGTGIAVGANLAAVGVGTETSGSILSPTTANFLVGIKPTVGLISRDGIIPITADQDTAGPMARNVRDAAILLGVLAGYGLADPATAACLVRGNCFSDYTQFLKRRALKGARIAVPPFPANRADIMNDSIADMRSQGAHVELIPALAPQLPSCPADVYPPAPGCSTVLNYGFKRDLNLYLASLGPAAPVQSLADVIAYNTAHAPASIKYGQVLALFSQMFDVTPGSADTMRYLADRAEDIARSRTALDGVFHGPDGIPGTNDDFDALLFSGNSGAGTPAKAGYPSICVPMGYFENAPTPPFPAGFVAEPGPAGITFTGPAFSEPRLIALAYAFEQATKARQPPASAPPLQ